MPDNQRLQSEPAANDGTNHEDEPIPGASDDRVLDETARLAREGQRQRENDPKERGSKVDPGSSPG